MPQSTGRTGEDLGNEDAAAQPKRCLRRIVSASTLAIRRQPWRVVRFGTLFGQMQARIHQIPVVDNPKSLPIARADWAGPIRTSVTHAPMWPGHTRF